MMKKMKNTALTARQQQLITPDMLDYAQSLVRMLAPYHLREDLHQEACYGLCVAACRYRPNSRTTFKSFSTWFMLKYVKLALEKEYSQPEAWETLPEILSPDEEEEDPSLLLQEALECLNCPERRIIGLTFGLKERQYTLQEAARLMHLSPSQAQKLLNTALNKIKLSNH